MIEQMCLCENFWSTFTWIYVWEWGGGEMLIITVESVLIGFNKLLPQVAYYVLQENPFKSSTNYSLLTLTFIITSALCQKGNKLSFNVC